ncbi:MAG: hypothetical protein A2516_10325 [Alphaproteobacteria bacterium RIFOXYD12_FULL_60_8]|nr:MAG: hypothetical protein A2516_10325 [Alphaproteobacteria bacterium RIFOXYD12_FULL_60_8]
MSTKQHNVGISTETHATLSRAFLKGFARGFGSLSSFGLTKQYRLLSLGSYVSDWGAIGGDLRAALAIELNGKPIPTKAHVNGHTAKITS